MSTLPPTPPALTTIEAAKDVVRAYYKAVNARDYRSAWRIWSGQRSYPAFVRGYARTRRVTVTFLPPFEGSGGAGSIYTDLHVRLDARLDNGRA